MRWKTWIGAALIVLSIAAMFLWETKLRDQISLRTVLVFSEDIAQGETVTARQLKTVKVTPQSVVEGALSASDADLVLGKTAVSYLKANQQVLEEYFRPALAQPSGYSCFEIKPEWVYSCSRLNEPGDTVSLYLAGNGEYLGSYRIRVLASDKNSGMELACSLSDYFIIKNAVQANGPGSLLIVNEAYK